MRRIQARVSLLLAAWATAGAAKGIVYVTDLEIFTYLAPCAASAINDNVQYQTDENCPEATDALQSCVCSKNNNFASISAGVISSVKYSCGSTATDDMASASTVLSAYCNQNTAVAFPTPTNLVSLYITDVPEISYLGGCASSILSEVVMGLTEEACPSDATAMATCACQKQQNSLVISQSINSEVKTECSNTADVSSAQAFFSAYCNLNLGTSAFPVPAPPPGDMTYYITDMPQYSSMAPCARNALSDAAQNSELCPTIGPQALASCACLKDGMESVVSSNIKYSILSWDCSSDDTDDVTSAYAVFDTYCSAARGEIKAAGISNSVAETTPIGITGTGGNSGSSGPKETGTSGSNGTSGGSGSSGAASGSNISANSSGSKTGAIVGAIAGVVVGLALLGVVVFFVMRNARRKRNAGPAPIQLLDSEAPSSKPELAGTPITGPAAAAAAMRPHSPSPSMIKHGHSPIMSSVSPVSAHSSAYPPPGTPELQGNHPPMPQYSSAFPPSNHAELYGQQMHNAPGTAPPNHSELPGQMYNANSSRPVQPELPGQMYNPNGRLPPSHAELQGQMYGNVPLPNRPQLYGQTYGGQYPSQYQQGPYGQQMQPQQQQQQQQQMYQGNARPPPQRAELMGWQSGPVAHTYAELDGGHAVIQEPHAQ